MVNVSLKRYWSIILSRKILSIILCLCYIAGLLLGLFLTSEGEKILFSQNVIDFTISALGKDSSTFTLFFLTTFSAIGMIVLVSIFGLSNWLVPFQMVVVIYRGYILGACAMVFVLNFKLTGIILFSFAVLVQNVVVTLGLIFLIVFAFDMTKDVFKCANSRLNYLYAILLTLVICIIGCLIEMLVLTFVLRPMNFYF